MSTSSQQSTETTSGLLTFGHSYYITNSRGELVSNAASFTNGGNEPAGNNGGKLSKLLVLFFMISNFVVGIATSNLKDALVCVGVREVVEPLQHGCKCSAWSTNIHGDIPAKNKPINFGFSSGTDAQC
ncbi:hypothetical protein CORT_0B02530 [Candida orthopsilosis Co 90-125]|uniref:Uncharacterized protein n=1 Tax=Candida orthopsilosis (strain 90-125) TaxID=1136231 RepID=H8X0S9_CANO9|nr:hypothetical protein CORT_0B02530 [Candida orthopsilosis Co 90-125]CCG21968.1 hypothetical protein CORT_0B02530 [Candida orthopsilosis Co 90-125]